MRMMVTQTEALKRAKDISPTVVAARKGWPGASTSKQVLLHRRGTDQFRPFIAHIVQRAAHRTPIHFRSIRIAGNFHGALTLFVNVFVQRESGS